MKEFLSYAISYAMFVCVVKTSLANDTALHFLKPCAVSENVSRGLLDIPGL